MQIGAGRSHASVRRSTPAPGPVIQAKQMRPCDIAAILNFVATWQISSKVKKKKNWCEKEVMARMDGSTNERISVSPVYSTPKNRDSRWCQRSCVVYQFNPDVFQLPVDSKRCILTRVDWAFETLSRISYYLIRNICKSTHRLDPRKIKICCISVGGRVRYHFYHIEDIGWCGGQGFSLLAPGRGLLILPTWLALLLWVEQSHFHPWDYSSYLNFPQVTISLKLSCFWVLAGSNVRWLGRTI